MERRKLKKVCYSIREEDDRLMGLLARDCGLPSKSAVLRVALHEMFKSKLYERIREGYRKFPETEGDIAFSRTALARYARHLKRETW